MGLLVIGAGHGRTGTTSLRAALVKLLEAPCYHMDEITVEGKIDDTNVWLEMLDAQAKGDSAAVGALAGKILNGYGAAIDWPASLFYKELMETYPEAKLILTVRKAESWYESTFDTLWGVRCAQAGTWMIKIVPFVKQLNKFVDALLWAGPNSLFKGKFTDQASACKIYNDWIEEVKKTVPKERLLVFDVKEGYAPLCKFLQLPEPAESFPNVNEKKRFQDLIKVFGTVDKIGKFVVAPAIVAGVVFVARRFLTR